VRVAFEYGVFLGCSERDWAWAHWLQQVIEAWRADPDMVGRLTPGGPVPATLRPVYRLENASKLTAGAVAALETSRSLVVLCSPGAALRPALDESLYRFAWLGRSERIVPVIVGGKPPDCLPPVLRPSEQLARIACIQLPHRPGGKALTAHRVLGRLTGLPADEIARRDGLVRRRPHDRRRAVAAALVAAALAGQGALSIGQLALERNEAWLEAALRRGTQLADHAVAAAQDLGLPESVTTSLLAAAEGRLRALATLGADPMQGNRRTAAMLIDLAPRFAALGARPLSTARIQEAERLLQPLAALPPGQEGTLAAALMAAAAGPLRDPDLAMLRTRLLAHETAGDALHAGGDLAGALREYEAEHRIVARLVRNGDPAADIDLGTVHARLAAVHEARGDFPAALASYETCREAGYRLVRRAADHEGWRRDLAVSHSKVATMQHRLGRTAIALAELRKGREIMATLTESDPDFPPWSADLTRFDERIAALEGRGPQRPALTTAHASGHAGQALR
jgi:hypothetical protein